MQPWKWFVVVLGALELPAQELVTAHHIYAPTAATALLHRGFGSAGDERAWTVVLAMSLPLAQLRDSLWLVGVASHLLQANSLNDIGFNPRGARWEEQLVLLWQRVPWTVYGGLLHFCKHEIDNADPPDTDEPVAGYQPTKRVIILHGPLAGAQYRHGWGAGWQAALELRAYAFLIAQDYRVRGTDELRWRRLWSSLMMRGSLAVPLGILRSFVQGMCRLALFRKPVVARYEWRAEIGAGIDSFPVVIFAYGEQLFDDLARPFPHPSRSFGVGLRWNGNE